MRQGVTRDARPIPSGLQGSGLGVPGGPRPSVEHPSQPGRHRSTSRDLPDGGRRGGHAQTQSLRAPIFPPHSPRPTPHERGKDSLTDGPPAGFAPLRRPLSDAPLSPRTRWLRVCLLVSVSPSLRPSPPRGGGRRFPSPEPEEIGLTFLPHSAPPPAASTPGTSGKTGSRKEWVAGEWEAKPSRLPGGRPARCWPPAHWRRKGVAPHFTGRGARWSPAQGARL